MSGLWIDMLVRGLICIASGEVAIRYASWWLVLAREDEKFVASPIILGVALINTFMFAFYIQLAMTTVPIYGLVSAIARLGVLMSILFFTYPVTKVVYGSSAEKAVVEALVRIYLIAVSAFIGFEGAMFYARLMHEICT